MDSSSFHCSEVNPVIPGPPQDLVVESKLLSCSSSSASVWNKDFSLGRLFLWKSRRASWSKQEIQKSTMGLGVTVTYANSVGFVYFVIQIVWSRLWWTYFLICFLIFTKIYVIISLLNKYPPCWSFKFAKSNQFKVDIKLRTGLT